jgi:hypothetical protein
MTEQYQCQSYAEDGQILNCTCGKCVATGRTTPAAEPRPMAYERFDATAIGTSALDSVQASEGGRLRRKSCRCCRGRRI